MIKFFSLFILMIVTILSNLPAGNANELPEDVNHQAQVRIDTGYHLGTVIGIIDNNGSRFYGFGQMSLTDHKKPNKNSIFEIGSLTKPFTTLLLAALETEGKMDFNEPVKNYVPALRNAIGNNGKSSTLKNLVTHTAGLPRNPDNTRRDDSNRFADYTVQDLNEFLSTYSFEGGTPEYSYSNLGFLILEHAIENELKSSYETLLQEKILDRLNLNDTHFDVPNSKRQRLVAGFRAGEITDEVNLGEFPAMGGLKSTAEDMLRFLGAQIGLVPSNLHKPIKLIQSEVYSDDEISMSLGWEILKREESGKTIYKFSGGTNGFVSFMAFDAEAQIGVVVLVNGTRYFSDLALKILDPTYPLRDVK